MSELRVNSVSEVGGDPVIAAGILDTGSLPAGSIIAVKDVLKTDTFTASVGASGNVAVTDLSITHEVSDPANKLIITAFFGVSGDTSQNARVGLAVNDGSGFIATGDSAGSRTSLTAGGATGAGTTDSVGFPSATFVHTPGAGSKTYQVHAVYPRGVSGTIYINRTENDADLAAIPRGASALVIQEVAV